MSGWRVGSGFRSLEPGFFLLEEVKGGLLSAGEDHGSVLLNLSSGKDGSGFSVAGVWSSLGASSALGSEWQTPILLGGFLYGMDNEGGAGPVIQLTCLEAATGKRVWPAARLGKGNLVAAAGKLFLATIRGELVVVRATPRRFEELGRQAVLEKGSRTGPALANGRLYLRDNRESVCLSPRGD